MSRKWVEVNIEVRTLFDKESPGRFSWLSSYGSVQWHLLWWGCKLYSISIRLMALFTGCDTGQPRCYQLMTAQVASTFFCWPYSLSVNYQANNLFIVFFFWSGLKSRHKIEFYLCLMLAYMMVVLSCASSETLISYKVFTLDHFLDGSENLKKCYVTFILELI